VLPPRIRELAQALFELPPSTNGDLRPPQDPQGV